MLLDASVRYVDIFYNVDCKKRNCLSPDALVGDVVGLLGLVILCIFNVGFIIGRINRYVYSCGVF